MRVLWESEYFISENTLTVNVNRLRSKLEDIGLKDLIVTKKSQGYIHDFALKIKNIHPHFLKLTRPNQFASRVGRFFQGFRVKILIFIILIRHQVKYSFNIIITEGIDIFQSRIDDFPHEFF